MGPGATWAFLGLFTGFGKLALVVSIGLLLFGRPGAIRALAPRALRPWLPAPGRGPLASIRLGRRSILALKILAWVALAAWMATRMTRIGPTRPLH